MKRILFLLLLMTSFFGNAQSNALFDQGKEQYKAENYQTAIDNWMKIIDAGEHSTAVYFNIANAHYKLNNIGPSIYYYEKALQLSPNDKEVLNNLAFAQNATVDSIEPLPETIFAKWDKRLASLLTYNGWARVTVIASVLFTILFLVYYFSVYSARKRVMFVGAILSIFVLLTGLIMSFRTYDQQMNDQPAIIFSESTEVKNEPNMGSETAFTLHEGTKVQILDEEDNWMRILILDGKEGWIPSTDLKAL
ncbi:MAG: tetratricopeptide repeat protein [Flavobacteriaceae bacterium]|nr:tetratricopeptide repeat protein [Flavobacteriaceae bacterium]